jgi:hypothetical protein
MLVDWLLAILNNALLGVVVGFGGAYLLQLRTEKKQEAERLQVRRSLRALLRDEIAHNQDFLRSYQGYLEKTALDAYELKMPERYMRLLARQVYVWHAMWQGQAQHLGAIFEPGEIVATARFHNDLDALVSERNAITDVRLKRDDAFARLRQVHSDPSRLEQAGAPIEETYLATMSELYEHFTHTSLHNLINMSNSIAPDN